ncbi:MAG: FAD:protein FMN transferase, partial [Clostridia bacterium]|nr:FAD:protein FMN transferase [Clostridia bacterium]
MKRIVAVLLIAALLPGLVSCKKTKKKYTDYCFDYFDTVTTLVGYADSKEEFDAVCTEIKGLLKEYHQLYDIYKRYDGVNNLCTVNDLHDGAHRPVQVDRRILDLLTYAKELYQVTGGKMNVAMGSVLSIWHYYRTEGIDHPDQAQLPPMDKLQEAAKHTDIEKLILNEQQGTVFLADPAMLLDVGAIAKGYATEQVAQYLEAKGIGGYLLNVGGNVRCVGMRADGEPWSIGLENPDTEKTDTPYIAYLHLADKSLVTS